MRLICIIAPILILFLEGDAATQPSQSVFQMPVEATVPENVIVTAALIPPRDSSGMFGPKIARSYAVIQVNLANQSNDQTFVLKNISIDYSDWVLANCNSENPPGNAILRERKPGEPNWILLNQSDAYAKQCRVGSMEVEAMWRVAQEGQSKHWRNWIFNTLTAAGLITGAGAAAFEGTLDLLRGTNAFNAAVPAGFRRIFPDHSIEQLQLLSSRGFRINTIVPKHSSVSVYAFFPISRFIGGDLLKIYLEEPALFFSPQQFLLDKKYHPFFKDLIAHFGTENQRESVRIPYREADTEKEKDAIKGRKNHVAQEQERVRQPGKPGEINVIDEVLNVNTNESLRNLLSSITLNQVEIVATGEMLIEVKDLPPVIDNVSIEKEDASVFGVKDGKTTVTVLGKNLATSQFTVTPASIKLTVKQATDSKVTLDLINTEALKAFATTIKFQASNKVGSLDLKGNEFPVQLRFETPVPEISAPAAALKLDVIKQSGFKLTGKNLGDDPKAVSARLVGPAADVVLKVKSIKPEELELDKVPATVTIGGHVLMVTVGGQNALVTIRIE